MPTLPTGRLLADASFLIGLADQDPDAARFMAVLNRTSIAATNFGEVLYKLYQRSGMPASRSEQIFVSLGIDVAEVSLADVRHFPELKRIDAANRATQAAAGTAAREIRSLSLGDMTCLGYARQRRLPVLTGDRHWTTLHPHGLTLDVYDFHDPGLTL